MRDRTLGLAVLLLVALGSPAGGDFSNLAGGIKDKGQVAGQFCGPAGWSRMRVATPRRRVGARVRAWVVSRK